MSAAAPLNPSQASPENLLARMKLGDRDAVAEFAMRYGDLIRLRIRDKIGPHLRRVLDSEDVLSTVTRRLDGLVRDRAIRAGSDAELWSLVGAIANHAVAENVRASKREQRGIESVSASDTPESWGDSSVADEASDISDVVEAISDETDRRILWLRLHNRPHDQIASEIGSTPSAVRMRWSRIRRLLRKALRH